MPPASRQETLRQTRATLIAPRRGPCYPLPMSAGILLFRRGEAVEVLLGHPGGPFFRSKEEGVWSVPKGLVEEGEDELHAALREFEEEVGHRPEGDPIDLGSIRQRSGKRVHAWAIEGTLPEGARPTSNTFTIEWPPKSGKTAEFPEIDRAEFFGIEEARAHIHPDQKPFLDRLLDALDTR